MSARPYTPEELDRLHAAGLSAVGHYNTPRTESDGEIVLGVLAGNDRYLKPAYCAGIRAEAARMEAERDPAKSDLLTELDRVKARFATRCDECAELRAEFARVTAERNAPDMIGHSEWLRGVEAECARILGVDADGDIRETAAQCVKERDAANERADKAERIDEAGSDLARCVAELAPAVIDVAHKAASLCLAGISAEVTWRDRGDGLLMPEAHAAKMIVEAPPPISPASRRRRSKRGQRRNRGRP